VLGVTRTATRAQIVAAYWKRAKAAHRDVGGSTQAMRSLTQARDEALAAIGER
jgi:curved DNA-binding protein CbpA